MTHEHKVTPTEFDNKPRRSEVYSAKLKQNLMEIVEFFQSEGNKKEINK